MKQPSLRSQLVTRRTYNRPIDHHPGLFETWNQTIDRVIDHQKWLWERALGRPLSDTELQELEELRVLMLDRKVLLSGRTLWLGGTDVSRNRESSMFNCAFGHQETVYDVVDSLWLLLQGCGVGFRPVVGTLTGFVKPIPKITIIRSTRTDKGNPENVEWYSAATGQWSISVGDSAEAWAKAIGKLLAGKYPAKELILDFSQIRPAGERLKGYGWISSGDEQISKAFHKIALILNRRAGGHLSRIDILDLLNHLGTVLSSRRSAEIALMNYGEAEWYQFATAKKDYWSTGNEQRAQSNNSLMFKSKPTLGELTDIFKMMLDAGGSEPGFINAEAAVQRAPWFKGCNPCAEILLGNKSFCNLTEVNIAAFKGETAALLRAMELAGRANYRQTCVDLRDGILQESWHLNNEFLRLCGVGLTGIAQRPDMTPYDFQQLRRAATHGCYSMADELGLPRPKNVTTVKPSGTLSKVMDCTEGVHKPLGKYIFNNVQMSRHDELVEKCRDAGYRVFPHPFDPTSVLVTMPVEWTDVEFDVVNGVEVNLESAVAQLERYKMLMENYCDHNVSATISYSPEEAPEIVQWLYDNWSSYVGVSFLLRADPTKTAADLGYAYLPQEVVTKEVYEEYVAGLKPVDIEGIDAESDMDFGQECAGGACPVR